MAGMGTGRTCAGLRLRARPCGAGAARGDLERRRIIAGGRRTRKSLRWFVKYNSTAKRNMSTELTHIQVMWRERDFEYSYTNFQLYQWKAVNHHY